MFKLINKSRIDIRFVNKKRLVKKYEDLRFFKGFLL